jgi:hypothetical protein
MSATLVSMLVLVGTLVLASLGGWPVTTPPPRTDGTVILTPPGPEPDQELLRGGLWIGLLERVAVAACVLSGHVSLIAVVVALKGLGRYPELKAHDGASERFLVGTFASLLWALAIGALGYVLLP